MISFISRFKEYICVALIILLFECCVSFALKPDDRHNSNIFHYGYKADEHDKSLALYKFEHLVKKEAEIILVGDSTAASQLKPSIINPNLNGKRLLNLGLYASLTFYTYRFLINRYLKLHPFTETVVLFITPYGIHQNYEQSDPAMELLRLNYASPFGLIKLPSQKLRIYLTNLFYYGTWKSTPHRYTETRKYREALHDTELSMKNNDGWMKFRGPQKDLAAECDFRANIGDRRAPMLLNYLSSMTRMPRENNKKFAFISAPVACFEFGPYSDFIVRELDLFAAQNPDAFIPYPFIQTLPDHVFVDRWHMRDEYVDNYSHGFGKLLKEWLIDKQYRNYYQKPGEPKQNIDLNKPVRSYTAEGILQSERNYRGNKLHGAFKTFYRDGALQAERYYVNGKLEGHAVLYWPNQKPRIIRHFKDGIETGAAYYFHEDGRLRKIQHYKNDAKNGFEILYNESQNIRRITSYRQGERSGVSYFYDLKGNLLVKEHFKNDLKHGPRSVRYQNGDRFYESNYTSGKKSGKEIIYREDGSLAMEAFTPLYSALTTFKAYNPDGQLMTKGTMKYDENVPQKAGEFIQK